MGILTGEAFACDFAARSWIEISPTVRCPALCNRFTLDEANADTVVRICATLQGLPLAIELAAARMRVLTPHSMLERLDRQLPLLVGAPRDDDKKRAMKVLRWFIGVTAERRYEVLDRQLFSDGFVQQHILHATGRDGALIALRVCIVIKVSAGNVINRIDEYFDPADLAPIMD